MTLLHVPIHEGPDRESHHNSRVDFFVNHYSQKINFHDHGSRKYKKKKKQIKIHCSRKSQSRRTTITHQAPHPFKSYFILTKNVVLLLQHVQCRSTFFIVYGHRFFLKGIYFENTDINSNIITY